MNIFEIVTSEGWRNGAKAREMSWPAPRYIVNTTAGIFVNIAGPVPPEGQDTVMVPWNASSPELTGEWELIAE